MFKLTIHFEHDMIGILAKISQKLQIKWNFELTVFELTVPDLYLEIRRSFQESYIIPFDFVRGCMVASFFKRKYI